MEGIGPDGHRIYPMSIPSIPVHWVHSPPSVFLGVGGNIGDSIATVTETLRRIAALDAVSRFQASQLYDTTPVGAVPQGHYINAACRFATTLPLEALHEALQVIERDLGKVPKPKDHPRVIDIDILLYGTEWTMTPMLEVPHPRWKERLFVVQPLSDLADVLRVPTRDGVEYVDLRAYLEAFPNSNNETVVAL